MQQGLTRFEALVAFGAALLGHLSWRRRFRHNQEVALSARLWSFGVPTKVLPELKALAKALSAETILSESDAFEMVADMVGRGCKRVAEKAALGYSPWWRPEIEFFPQPFTDR